MKTKNFLFIFCLFTGAALMSLSAQTKPETIQGWSNGIFTTEVYCDGVMLGTATGTVDFHFIHHLGKDGNWTSIYQAKGTAVGDWTEEKFTYKERDKVDWSGGDYSWIYHLKGDMGSRFMGHITWNMYTDEISLGPIKCK